jgi:hypothetical protein
MAADADQLFGVHPTGSGKIWNVIAKLTELDRETLTVLSSRVLSAGARHTASDEFNRTSKNIPFPRARFA